MGGPGATRGRPRTAPPRSQSSDSSSASAHGPLLVLVAAYYAVLVHLALRGMHWTPEPLPDSTPAHRFAEGRARQHVRVLTEDIGFRSVSTPGLQAAQQYLLSRCRQLQDAAAARGDVTVEVDVERYHGDFPVLFMGHQFWNVYHNISNVLLHVARKGSEHLPAVMLVAHYDSPVSSQGAGDDAANVGVMLELAANLLAVPADQLPEHPVLFLFSGAEEPLCQSANAWTQFSRWASRVGVFVNLESIGPGGVPIVFQHAGAWVVEAYARAARTPRGSIAGQDVFDAGLVVGDTDFRQLSYRHMGGLPGLDVAYLLDGAAYHTDRDALDRLRPGVLQETGDTLGAVVAELSSAMAAAAAAGTLDQLLRPPPDAARAVFFSLGGRVMVTYRAAAAAALHQAPLALALVAPWALAGALPGGRALAPGRAVRAMAGGGARGAASLLLALAGPAAFGALRAAMTGVAMPWFAHSWMAHLTYFPVSVAAMLLPWQGVDYSNPKGAPMLAYHVLGSAGVNALLGAALSQLGVGIAAIFSLWGLCGLLAGAALAAAGGRLGPRGLGAALLLVLPPAYLCCETSLALMVALLSRLSLTGHLSVALGDGVAGLLLGVGALSCTGLVVLPVARCLLGPRCRAVTGCVLLAAAAGAVAASCVLRPYSAAMPKRVLLNHLHYHDADAADAAPLATTGGGDGAAAPPPGDVGWPEARVTGAAWALSGCDSTSVTALARAMGLDASAAAPPSGSEWLVVYPISTLLDTLRLPASPSPPGALPAPPSLRLVSQRLLPLEEVAAGAPAGAWVREVTLEVSSPAPCWGALRAGSAAPLVQWRLQEAWRSTADCVAHGCRFAPWPRHLAARAFGGEEQGRGPAIPGPWAGRDFNVKWTSEEHGLVWRVGLRYLVLHGGGGGGGGGDQGAAAAPKVELQLHAAHLQRTPALAEQVAALPPWAALSYEATTFVSSWEV